MYLYYDWTWLLLIPAMIFAIYAQMKVSSTYEKFSQVISRSGYTGAELARQILNKAGAYSSYTR